MSIIPGWWEVPHSITAFDPIVGPQPRLDLRTRAIGQREECLAGKAGAAEEHTHLRERQPRAIQGDPSGVADDREAAVAETSRAMRRQAARTGAPRQQIAPEGAVLRQVLWGYPSSRSLILHVRPFGTLTKLVITGRAERRNHNP